MITLKRMLICVAVVVLTGFFGCSRKEDAADPVESTPDAIQMPRETASSEPAPTDPARLETTPPQPAAAADTAAAFDRMVELVQGGQQEEAARVFLAIDWTGPDVFAGGSVLGMSEAEFKALPQTQRIQAGQQSKETAGQIREIAKLMVGQAKENPEKTQAYRSSLKAFAGRLSGEDQLLLIQSVGKAIAKYVEMELGPGN